MSDKHDAHHVNYLYVFVALCVFTGLSVLFDVVDIKDAHPAGLNGYVVLIVLVLAVAAAKALCVMMFFMHLKFEGNWKYVLLAPTTILALGLPLALLPDVGLHYYVLDVPQTNVVSHAHAAEEAGRGKSGHGSHDAPAGKDGAGREGAGHAADGGHK